MLASITPLGERGRGFRWGHTVTFFVLASTIAGGLLGIGLGMISGRLPISPTSRLLLFGAATIIGVMFDLHLFEWNLPTLRRQVNRRWLDKYRGWVYGVGFGAQLGVGVTTIVTTSAVYAAILAIVLSGPIWSAFVIGLVFGFVRGATILAGAKINTASRLYSFHQFMNSSYRRILGVGLAMQTLIGASLLAGALLRTG